MVETFVRGPAKGGAGTEITARDESVNVQVGLRGPSLFIGPAQKGLSGVQLITDESAMRRKLGRPLSDDYISEAMAAWFQTSSQQGLLYFLRVTADTDLGVPTGELTLYERDCDAGYHTSGVRGQKLRNKVGVAKAASAGEWAGPAYYYGGSVADDSAAISGQDFTTGLAIWAEDELVGATFALDGHDREYEILGNTAAGVFSLDGGFTTYTTTGGATKWRVYRTNTDTDGNPMELAVRIADDGSRPLNDFALLPVLDRSVDIARFDALDLRDTDAIELKVEQQLDNGGPNEELALDFSGIAVDDTSLPEARPANWVSVPLPVDSVDEDTIGHAKTSGKKVYFKVFDFTRTAGSNNIRILPSSITWGSAPMGCRITLTGVNSTTMSVSATDLNGRAIASGLSNLTVGTAYASQHPHLPGFTVAATVSTVTAGDTYVLEFRPFPSDLKYRNARVHVSAFATSGDGTLDPTTSYKVIDSGEDWLTLATGDTLATAFGAPEPPSHLGSVVAGTIDTSGGKTFIYTITTNGVVVRNAETFTVTGTASDTLTQVAAALNAADDATEEDLYFYVTSTNKLGVICTRDFGADVSLAISGTLLSDAGLTAATYTGSDGTIARLEYNEPMRNARPEHHGVTNLDYTTGALAADDSNPAYTFIREYPGLVHFTIPGKTDSALHQAAADFAAAVGAVPVLDLPDSTTIATEEQAAKWRRNNLTIGRLVQHHWPSWGHTTQGVITPGRQRKVPASGAVLGAMVAYANTNDVNGAGWHKAPGGLGRVRLNPYFSKMDTGTAAGAPRQSVSDAKLNNAGILPIIQKGATIYVHGDQSSNPGFLGTAWLHKVKTYYDIIAVLANNFSDLEYWANLADGGPLAIAMEQKASALLEPYVLAGALDPLTDGQPRTIKNCVKINVGDELNTESVRNAGRRLGAVEFKIVNTTKVIGWTLTTSGISVPPLFN